MTNTPSKLVCMKSGIIILRKVYIFIAVIRNCGPSRELGETTLEWGIGAYLIL
jgi:hypothetical protein